MSPRSTASPPPGGADEDDEGNRPLSEISPTDSVPVEPVDVPQIPSTPNSELADGADIEMANSSINHHDR